MDLGLTGRRAIVCASSKGLGRACALALAREGVDIVLNGREADALSRTTDEVAALGVRVTPVIADVTTDVGRAALTEACSNPDIVVTNVAGPPLGDFREWDAAAWQDALNDLMISPILLVRSVIDGMVARRFGRIVNITSVSVRMPALDRGLTNGAKTGLTGFMSGLARQCAVHNVTVNNILPGFFETDRGRKSIEERAARASIDLEEFRSSFLERVPARRMGDPDEVGQLCAYLCSAGSGYVTGQNMTIDGGLFNSTF